MTHEEVEMVRLTTLMSWQALVECENFGYNKEPVRKKLDVVLEHRRAINMG